MKVAVVKETLPGEARVALVPQGGKALSKAGLDVHVESGAGSSAGASDEEYREAGATVASSAAEALQGAGFTVYGHVMKGTGHGIAPDGLSVALAFIRDVLSGDPE